MNKRLLLLALFFLLIQLHKGYSQLPLQPRHTLKVFPGLVWNMVGYEFCPTAHLGIHFSAGGAIMGGYPQGVAVVDLRWYPMREGGKRFGETNRGILPYVGLWGAALHGEGEEGSSSILFGPGLIAGMRWRLGKRPSIDFKVGGVPDFLVYDLEDDWRGPVIWPRVSLTFGWTLGLRGSR